MDNLGVEESKDQVRLIGQSIKNYSRTGVH